MSQINDVIIKFLEDTKQGIINDANSEGRGSSRVESSLEIQNEGDIYRLLAWQWIESIWGRGRGKTQNSAKGSPTLREKLEGWLGSKGMDKKLAYPIARKIHKEGNLLYRTGGTSILSRNISDAKLNKLSSELGVIAKKEIIDIL